MMWKKNFRPRFVAAALALVVIAVTSAAQQLPPISVSSDGRHLTREGKAFFYLGDTAWEIFQRLTREEAEAYLTDRSEKGFNVIAAPALPIFGRLKTPNRYGHVPLRNTDPLQPDDDYFDHLDYVIGRANAMGMYFALSPSWGDKVNMTAWPGSGPEIFTPENARQYGEWIAKRLAGRAIIWMLGGDRNPETPSDADVYRAFAAGIGQVLGPSALITFHPEGKSNSADFFHAEPWLDFNMVQTGHTRRCFPVDSMILSAVNRAPGKPVIDGEPSYEDHPIDWRPENGRFNALDIRRAAYSAVLSGACGHVYGNHNIWQFWEPGREPISAARTPWRQALRHDGSAQMGFCKEFFEAVGFERLRRDTTAYTPRSSEVWCAATEDGTLLVMYTTRSEVALTNAAGRYRFIRYFDPETGTWKNPVRVRGNRIATTRPARGADYAVVLTRRKLNLPVAQ